ncbi:MAG TPA: hypothetical protein PL169_22310, partial [Leptospiraceae bacterium]|nr:hypothetical protein [Leptospiraceae bacterium]
KDAVEEIYIVFETTNRRGKQLTKLELLKNRLLYLSTLKTDVKTQSKFKDLIPKVWNTIYEFLGMFPESPISLDDKFLMDHWTMYQRHLREKEFYAEDLLNRYFTSVNYLEGKTIKEFRNVKINQDELEYYVKDLEESIENWFNMQNPVNGVPDHQDDLYNKSITYYLYKLNQFNSSLFNPMILSLLNLQKKGELKEDEIVNALKEIERYNFMLFSISDLKSDTGSSKFFKSANLLYNSYNRRTEISDLYTVSNFIDEIQKEIFKSLNFYHLHAQMMNLAGNTKSEGFFHWKGSKYLLLEYEEKESKKSGIKKNQYESGQYKLYKIFPYFKKHTYEFNQNPEKLSEAWDASFKKYDESEKLKLASSLGNIVILPEGEKINPEMSYDAIRNVFKKSRMKTVRDIASKYEKWNANAILKRGLELLNFIETNWIPQEYHKKIDFNPELKQRILYFEKFKIKD